MADKPDSKSSIQEWVKNFSAFILGAIALFKGITEFVKLFQGNDTELLTWITLAASVALLCAICLYYARFWQPEKDDKGTSGFTPTTDEQVKQQSSKEKQRKVIRRSALAGLVLIPLLSLAGFAGWHYHQSQPSKTVLILVADFDGPDPKKYGIGEFIRENLRQATQNYSDVKVKPLGRVITESDGKEVAQEEGEKKKAAIVIWGWYRQPKTDLLVNTNFQLLKPTEYLPELGKGIGDSRRLSLAELESFNIKIRPASQMSYLTLLTLGLSRYSAKDLDKAIALDSKYALAYNNRGVAKANLGNQRGAIKDFDQAIALDPKFAFAHSNRGLAKADLGDKQAAIKDYDQAIALDPKYALAYYNRGLAYRDQGDKPNAIKDFKQVLELTQDLEFRQQAEQELKKLGGR